MSVATGGAPVPRSGGASVAALALLVSMPLSAQVREEVLVTGTRLAAPEQLFPGAGTVIDAAEISARNDATVLDLLREVPGVQVSQPGPGGVPQVFIRGGEPNFTIFLLDGIRVNDLNNTRGGSFDLASLNLGDIERIEIVRGPQSSIYGSDGLAGVINIISKRGGRRLAAVAEAEGGGDDYRRGQVGVSGPLGAGSFSLQAGHRDDGEPTSGSTYETSTVGGQLRLVPRDDLRVNFYGRYADSEGTSFPEDSGGPERAALRDLDTRSGEDLSVGGDFDWRLGDVWSVQGLASWYERQDKADSPGVAPGVRDPVPPNGSANDLERLNASLRTTAELAQALRLTVGADYLHEDGESLGYLEFAPGMRIPADYALDRSVVGAFGEIRFNASDSTILQASVRHDEPDEVSGETTWKAGALYLFHGGASRLRLNAGTGFKLPSFFALGHPLVGNPDLRPEKSRSIDAGITRVLGEDAAAVGVTLFAVEYEDLIDFDPETFTNVNRSKVTSVGFELEASASVNDTLDARAHLTYTDLDVKDADRNLLQRPQWRGGAGLRWTPRERWLVDLAWLHVGGAYDSSIPTGEVRLDAWNRVDLNVQWRATPRLRLALAVDNLLDADYEEAVGFPASGIRPRFTIGYGFGG